MAEKRLIDANELEEKAIYITGPKGSACHAVPLGLIQAAPTIDPETLRPTAHIIRGYVPETKDGVFCDGQQSAWSVRMRERKVCLVAAVRQLLFYLADCTEARQHRNENEEVNEDETC